MVSPLPLPKSARIAKDWRGVPPQSHFSHVYASDAELVQSLCAYVADGIWGSDRVVVMATAAHRDAMQPFLRERNIDPLSGGLGQQLLILDAQETLGKFLLGGMPDRALFFQTVGQIIRHAATGGRRVRAFAEMVALLCRNSNHAAAIALEGLWKELARECPFTLYCGYAATDLRDAGAAKVFSQICQAHSAVIAHSSGTTRPA